MRRGFALVELAAAIVVLAAAASLLVIGFGNNRRLARLGSDESNLRQIGAMTGAYGADSADLFWSFSWKKGGVYSAQYPDLNNAPSDMQAGANQAVEILRRRAGRTDIQQITSWFANLTYSHLVLEDYSPMEMPNRLFISSGDRHRLLWASNPKGFDAGLYQPAPPSPAPGSNAGKRWPYSASFQLKTVFYDRSPVNSRVQQAFASHSQYFLGNSTVLEGTRLPACVFPSEQVHLHDSHARHFGARMPYAAHDQARLPLLFVDGAVSVRGASESNAGWRPLLPASPDPTTFNYAPAAWEPPTMSGGTTDTVIGRFRWTRGTLTESGIVGRDFGAPEVGP